MKPSNVFKAGNVFRQGRRSRRPRRPLPRLRGLPLNVMLPNAVTVLALCSGLAAIRFSTEGRFVWAVAAVAAAALFDAMDGRVARLLNGQSAFGAELDSLSDVISFGVAPAMTLFLWSMSDTGGFGWVAATALAVCCALRLARFNVGLGVADPPPWAFNYFTGVPAPAGAGLALTPLYARLATGWDWFAHPLVVAPWTLLCAGLMVSTLPTFSFKKIRVPHEYAIPGLAAVGFYAGMLASRPWTTLALTAVGYLATIPVSYRHYNRLARAAETLRTEEAATTGEALTIAPPPPADHQ